MLFSLIAMVFCFWLAIVALQTPDQRKEIVVFAAASALIGVWTSFPFFMTIITDPHWQLLGARAIYTLAAFVPFFFWYLYFIVMELREKRDARMLQLACASSIVFSVLAWHPRYLTGVTSLENLRAVIPGPLFGFFVLYFGVIGFYGSYRMLAQFQHAEGGRRNRYKYLFLGFGIAYCGGLLHFAAAYIGREPIPHDLFVISFVAILAYAILKHQILEIELVVRDWMVYVLSGGATATVLFAACYPWLHQSPVRTAAVIALGTGWLTPVSFPRAARNKEIPSPSADAPKFCRSMRQRGEIPFRFCAKKA